MDLRPTSANESRTKAPLMITSALVSAVLEWILILMLFIEASFSYLVTKFAHYCQLQVPCLLCSRLDHVLGNERAGFYWELICRKHKSKISSLIFCQLHDNLVDIHGTCESCLSSFATIKKSNTETYSLLVGKSSDEPYCDPSQAASSDEHNIGGKQNCKCCNEQWIPGTCTQKLFCSRSINSERAEVNKTSPFTSICNVDDMQEIMEGSSQTDQTGNKDKDSLPRIEYTKVKVTSDGETEGPLSDNESADAHFHELERLSQDLATECVLSEPKIVSVADEDPALEKLIHPTPQIKSLTSELEEPSSYAHNENFELVSFPEALASSSIKGNHHEEPKDINVSSTTELEKEVHAECGEGSNMGSGLAGTTELRKDIITKCGETSMAGSDCILENKIQIDLKPTKTETSTQMTENLDLGDAYKLAVGVRGRQLSGRFLEQQRSMTDSTRASEDLKLLLSQISSRGMDLPLNDMSPRVSVTSEDLKALDASSVIGMHILERRISFERNESSLSVDGSVVSEIDGESVADRLKRQVDHDKKIISVLYKELEEERNASAIAANQAMAMITRLQEEKAALNMEALQCLRMMEEQAEYDGEALQTANDLLSEKEKQLQNFEYELQLYRNQFGDISLSNSTVKPRPESDEGKLKAQEVEANDEISSVNTYSISNKGKHDTVDHADAAPKLLDGYTNTGSMSLPQFEDEKQFIIKYLRKLEGKLNMFSRTDVYPDLADGAFSTGKEEVLQIDSSNQVYCTRVSNENGGTESNHLPSDGAIQRETSSEDKSGHSPQHQNEGHEKFNSRIHVDRDAELDEFRLELSAMNKRLKALEAEQNVIECSINSLEKGSEGFRFIRDIAVRIQELHLAYIRRSEDLR